MLNQNKEARRLLDVLKRQVHRGTPLTYVSAAQALGHTAAHARAVAQVCDALDAAAALARVPLLALVWVRDANQEINRKAWAQPDGLKDRIVQRSLRHKFSDADFGAIAVALSAFDGVGSQAAWRIVRKYMGNDENLFASVIGVSLDDARDDAIEDLGSDAPERIAVLGFSYRRDPAVRQIVIDRAKGRCELCGVEGFIKEDGSRYIEAHHIIALSAEGADRVDNVIALCPHHHREAHFGKNRVALEQEMVRKLIAMSPGRSQ